MVFKNERKKMAFKTLFQKLKMFPHLFKFHRSLLFCDQKTLCIGIS